MTVVTTVQLRKNMKSILEKVSSGEQIIIKYYNQSFLLKPTILETDIEAKRKLVKKKKLSPQAQQIVDHFNSPEHKLFAEQIKKAMPELYNMTPQEEKEYIRNEKAKKYGL